MLSAVLAVVTILSLAGVIALEKIRRTQAREITRSAVLVRFGRALAEGLFAGEDVADSLRMLLPGHADWCVLHLVEGPRVRRAAVVHVDPGSKAPCARLSTACPSSVDAPIGPGTGHSIRPGRDARARDRSHARAPAGSGRAAAGGPWLVTSAFPSNPAARRLAR